MGALYWTDIIIFVGFVLTFLIGYWAGKTGDKKVTRYRCCDHCYKEDGELAHGSNEIDNHTTECMEYVNGVPCPVGSEVV